MNTESIFSSKRLEKTLLVTFLLLSVFLFAQSIKTFKTSGNDIAYNAITVNGKGEVFAVADIATFSFSVNEEGKDVVEAQKKATEKNNNAIKFLKDNGIEDKDIKNVNYNVNPKYSYNIAPCTPYSCPPSQEPKIIGYQVSHYIEVKIRNVEKAGDILSGIGAIGVSNISGLTFTIDDEEVLKAEARKKAIEDAKEKAKSLSKDLGVRLGKITSFYENNDPGYYGGGYGGAMMDAKVESAPSAIPNIPIGENKIIVNVSVTYKIK